MAEEYALRCTMCGLTNEVSASAVDQLNVAKNNDGSVYVCDACQLKVRYESEQKYK
jgi:hypothetical protein